MECRPGKEGVAIEALHFDGTNPGLVLSHSRALPCQE